ncbi:D-hydantoinase [Dipodascopsis uninucleata]
MNFDLVVTNGIIVTSSQTIYPPNSDIGVVDGVITSIGRGLVAFANPTATVIDADGAHVTPGGVDTHVHISQGSGGVTMDGFDTGTRSAICGGTTSIVCFAQQDIKEENVIQCVKNYHMKAESHGGTYCDYGFHVILTNPTKDILERQLPILKNEEGISSVKLYMSYDQRQLTDQQIMSILAVTRQLGMTTMIHAENWDMIKFIIKQLEERKQTDPYYHAVSRPAITEIEAAYRAICLAELMDAPILLVHISTRKSRDHVRDAQTRMLPVHAETCPQYLYLLSDALKKSDYEGAKYVCSPPLRDNKDDIDALWEGIANGTFTTISSDHAPSCFDHQHGKKIGLDPETKVARFTKIPNGLPGVETRLPLAYQGVNDKRITAEKFVEVTSTNPAKLYGLDKKGVIAPGYDADIVIWYPINSAEGRTVVTNEKLHHRVDYTPYEGYQLDNWPRYTILRGMIVWDRDNNKIGPQGYGKFVKRTGNMLRQPRDVWVNEWRPFEL